MVFDCEKDADLEHDLALILLNDHAWLSENVREICLSAEAPKNSADCVLTGFGYTDDKEDNSQFLRHGKFKLIEKAECHESWSNFTVVENTICAGEQLGPSACKGNKRLLWV